MEIPIDNRSSNNTKDHCLLGLENLENNNDGQSEIQIFKKEPEDKEVYLF